MSNAIEHLSHLYGIGESYRDFRGELQIVSLETRAAILAAIGVDASGEHGADNAVHQHDTVRWTRLLPPVAVVRMAERIVIPVSVPLDLHAQSVHWTLKPENGEPLSGSVQLDQLETIEKGAADGRSYRRVAVTVPELDLGYHGLSIELDTGLAGEARLIVVPQRCFEPDAIARGQRLWGIAVQLYALRSENNWGIGDFADLRELIRAAAPLGCSIVGLNPLHALMPANPAHISPYSPSSRQFLNVLYIAVTEVAELAGCEAARERLASPEFRSLLNELRATDDVDYVRAAAAKFEVLKLLYAHFRAAHLEHDTDRAKAFRSFVDMQGEALRLHAVFDALDAHLHLQGPQYWGWPSWPEEYRDPMSSAVNRFARERVQDVEYFLYLQWLAAEQLAAAQLAARHAGMAIGLYGDVAVGVDGAGSETWSNRHLYCKGASVGAPPDELALKGQDWGIPPQEPNELRLQQYAPFIAMLRNNMRHVGALRLDHVMALFRLWWVPQGMSSAQGAYMHYPVDDLIGILSLESVRNQCLVVGEDLGTVPPEMSRAMKEFQVYHYKVLLFEKDAAHVFHAPHEYTRHALATVTTHDLPTLRGWWESLDIQLRATLDLYPSDAVKHRSRAVRAIERRELMKALVRAGLWRWNPGQELPGYSDALSRAIHCFLGLSNANAALVQIEDLIGMTDPVNVPGTHAEHANWQRKVAMSTADILACPQARETLQAMNIARTGRNPNH